MAHTDGDSLLSHGHVHGSLHLVFRIMLNDQLFRSPDEIQFLVEIKAKFGIHRQPCLQTDSLANMLIDDWLFAITLCPNEKFVLGINLFRLR